MARSCWKSKKKKDHSWTVVDVITPALRTPRQQDLKNKMKTIKQHLLVRAFSENMEYVLFYKEKKK